MKKFIIERHVPGAGKLSPEELQTIAKTSVSAMAVLGKPYRWVESYVTNDKIYCVHEADTEDVIREHSGCANFPISHINEVKEIFGPETAEEV